MIKTRLILVSMVLLLLACPKKSDIFVPVLLDYILYYPDEARRLGLEGKVVVGVLVDESGRSLDAKIARTSGYNLLDSAAIYTARSFVFSPGIHGDKPVKSWVLIPLEFTLELANPEIWLAELNVLQQSIKNSFSEDKVKELYNMYKQVIYAPKGSVDTKINYFIKDAVLDSTARLWDGFWRVQPAQIILIVDIIYRYPKSYTSYLAKQDLNVYLEKEALLLKNTLPQPEGDSLLNRLRRLVQE